jgi:DNA polymerase III delta subunit
MIKLYHGENEYLLFKNLKELKKSFQENNEEFNEVWGDEKLKFAIIYELLESSSFFSSSSTLILRNLGEHNSIYSFVDELIEYLKKNKPNNDLIIFHQSKLAKTTKIYKLLAKIGEIEELNNPSEIEIKNVIKKSISIESDALNELYLRTQGNLFLIRNEIKKLTLLIDSNKKNITINDIETYTTILKDSKLVWNLGRSLINYLINKNNNSKLQLLNSIEKELFFDTEPMMILYSFYNYILNFIKLKKLSIEGKGFKEAMSLGYYFTKEYYPQKDKIDLEELYHVNTILLEYEYKVKIGQIDYILGLKRAIISI